MIFFSLHYFYDVLVNLVFKLKEGPKTWYPSQKVMGEFSTISNGEAQEA